MAKKLKIEQGKPKGKWNISGLADNIIERDMISGPHIEAFGNSRIIIDGCLGVFEYRNDYLKLKLSKGALILCGNGFNITVFEGQQITIKGKISSVEFCF